MFNFTIKNVFLLVFILFINNIIILNEKFLLLGIFIAFVLFIKIEFSSAIVEFFATSVRELRNEIFLNEYLIEFNYELFYHNYNSYLMRELFLDKLYYFYLNGIGNLLVFYYNFIANVYSWYSTFTTDFIVNDLYYQIVQIRLYFRLNYVYQSYYKIFKLFSTV